MKTDLLAQTTDDACESTDSTSEYSLLTTESSDVENMEKLREKISNQDAVIRDLETKLTDAENNILNQNEKIKLYEATIRDKNDLIELIKETKGLAIKQLKDQIADLQNALDLSKNPTLNEDDANAAESAEFEKKLNENEYFQNLQKQFAESDTVKEVISQLKSTNELKSKMDEYINELAILKQRSGSEQDELRAKIAELEKNAKIYESKEDETKLAKCASNDKSGQSTGAPLVLLNHTKMANIKCFQVDNQKHMAIVENIPCAGPDWVVILRRFDGSVSFANIFPESIGDLCGEYWLGFELIHQLTSSIRHELYIELVDFDDVTAYARYDNFVIGSESHDYALKSLGAYSGNAGDALRSHENACSNCLSCDKQEFYWWFSSNNQCCLTGPYHGSREKLRYQCGMYWGNWYLGKRYPLKACKMLIRPHK